METYINQRDIIEASRKMYERNLRNIILPTISSIKLSKVTPTTLQRLLNTRSDYSTSDTAKVRICIKALFKQAYLDRLIPYDPSAGLQMPKTHAGTHRSLTNEERKALIAAAMQESFDGKPNTSGLWVLSLLYCGLRPAETAALRWEDIDLKNKVIYIRRSKEAASTRIKVPKTSAGARDVRDVPIPEVYSALLRKHRCSQGYVFTQHDGVFPLTDSSMRRKWQTIKKYMDIELGAEAQLIKSQGKRKRVLTITKHALAPDLDLYDLRHTYCTDLQKKGVPINLAKELMGHADISTTANIYTHGGADSVEMARHLIGG